MFGQTQKTKFFGLKNYLQFQIFELCLIKKLFDVIHSQTNQKIQSDDRHKKKEDNKKSIGDGWKRYFSFLSKEDIRILQLPAHHDQSLHQGIPRVFKFRFVRKKDMKAKRESNDEDKHNHQNFKKCLQDILKNCYVLSQMRELPNNYESLLMNLKYFSPQVNKQSYPR